MSSRPKTPYALIFGLILGCAGLLFAQTNSERTLILNGKTVGTVVQVGGHPYVALETVARIMNGSVTIEPNRVLLSATGPESAPPEARSNAAPVAPPAELSREFARAAIAELEEMREWRGAIGTILSYGVPVVGTWPQDYHDRVESNLQQVSLTVSTDADSDAFQLLRNNFYNLAQWAGDVVATRNSLNATKTVDPNAAQNDETLTKISNCSRFLSSMLVSGKFADNASCH